MGPDDGSLSGSGRLDASKLQEISTRLGEVRRRCFQDDDFEDRRDVAIELLDAVLADLGASMAPGGPPLSAADLDLGLATVEEMFETAGSPGFVRVIASIRGSLQPLSDGAPEGDDPPPPRRFNPPPSAASRRLRPRPKPRAAAVSKAPVEAKARSGRLIAGFLILVAVSSAGLVAMQRGWFDELLAQRRTRAEVVAEETAPRPDFDLPPLEVEPVEVSDDFDVREEEMARFTFEIRLAQQSLVNGELNESLRHFAAAAAIDRHHHRVITMGKALISALLQDADQAYDAGNVDRAGRRVQSARDLARGLRLDESPIDSTARKHAAMTRFEDLDPSDSGALDSAVQRPVRLTLKSRDVVFGHLTGIEGDLLLVDVYSGIDGGEAEFSARILRSTIRSIRVYDARDPSEIVTGD